MEQGERALFVCLHPLILFAVQSRMRSLCAKIGSWWSGTADPLPSDMDSDVVVCSAVDLCVTEFTPTCGLVLHERLDAGRLKAALFQAVEKKLPRAGARLAVRNGLYEFHIPRTFSDDVPPVRFTHTDFPGDALSTHAVLPPRVPDGLDAPCWTDMPDCVTLFRAPGTPGHLHDFLRQGVPLVHAHVTTFRDATLIGVTSSHIGGDAHGMRALYDAWTAALRGELDTIDTSPRDFEPIGEILRDAPTLIAPPKTKWFAGLRVIVQFMLRSWFGGREAAKLLYVPQTWLAARKAGCMAELAARGSDEWVGSSDVLTASILKMIHAHRAGDPQKIHLYMPVNLRPKLPATFRHPYPNNAFACCEATPTAAGAIAAQPLVDTALAIRRPLNHFTSPSGLAEVRGELAWRQRHTAGKKGAVFPLDPHAEFALISNWRSAKFTELDFSGAREGYPSGAEGQSKSGPVTPVFVPLFFQDGFAVPMRGSGVVMSETDYGIWTVMTMYEEEWERLKADGSLKFV